MFHNAVTHMIWGPIIDITVLGLLLLFFGAVAVMLWWKS